MSEPPPKEEPVKSDVPVVPVTPVVPETPPPQFVKVEDFTNLQASIADLKDNVTNFFLRQNAPQGNAPQQIQIEDVTDEQYASALAGEVTSKPEMMRIIKTRHNAERMRDKLELQQQIGQIQSVGLGAIGNLTKQGLKAKPYYDTYKKEVDAAVAKLDPQLQVNAEALDGVYNYVIGQHIGEIVEKERETTLRKAAETPPAQAPGRQGGGSSQGAGSVPDVSEVLGKDAVDAIKFKYGGRLDADSYARSQGYKDWGSMYEKIYKPLEGNA